MFTHATRKRTTTLDDLLTCQGNPTALTPAKPLPLAQATAYIGTLLAAHAGEPFTIAKDAWGEVQVLDGRKRLAALRAFINGEFAVPATWVHPTWLGISTAERHDPHRTVTYDDLTESARPRFGRLTVNITEVIEARPEDMPRVAEIANHGVTPPEWMGLPRQDDPTFTAQQVEALVNAACDDVDAALSEIIDEDDQVARDALNLLVNTITQRITDPNATLGEVVAAQYGDTEGNDLLEAI